MNLVAQTDASAIDTSAINDFVLVQDNKYHIGDETYSYLKLKRTFSHYTEFDDLASVHFTTKTLGRMSVVVGAGFILRDLINAINCSCEGGVLYLYRGVLYAIPFGIAALIFKGVANKKKAKSIQTLNGLLKAEPHKANSGIQIRPAKTGLGIVVVF